MTPSEEPTDAAQRARRPRARGILAIPIAIVGTIAMTLGIATPADAATPSPKRQAQKRPPQAGERALARDARVPIAPLPAEHLVAPGDTIAGIAERYGLRTAELLAANGLGWSTLVFPGQVLVLSARAVPAATAAAVDIRRHTVAPGETVQSIAEHHGLDVDAVLSANGLGRASLISPGQSIVLPDTAAVTRTDPSAPPHTARPG